ncbi:PTS sugar transporter subunit IIA [Actinobacteria bacterium YIM 96077]|uniref:Ascorbate-specific PTS system EIIA component n=1 Tax=Phytoactinopolyspora halophila TaxID=1981511 RepID=A0A329QZ81_9ACTN|nr:PTS sugar transporter subunit IIA [Phytoactinopolyspora halophila]AYY13236.1 PTS sugar transporter subunit IIA [Actinobacteria bacterium YIM 96077]RAW17527.1 PTS sugar transporter subunit IIA [Phytoactinopolyspora halophila]
MSVNLADELTSIVTRATADDWRAAITLAGDGLVAGGVATEDYTREMIETVEEHGSYIVIAPGLALAHARPSPAVLKTGLSWVGLDTPVEFGHPTNDPVRLVIGLAATDHDGHIAIMAALAQALVDPVRRERLADAADADEVRALLADDSH